MPRARPHGLMQLKRKEIKDAFEILTWITPVVDLGQLSQVLYN
jgi:hypothetical protein